MHCSECGVPAAADALFCHQCGTRLTGNDSKDARLAPTPIQALRAPSAAGADARGAAHEAADAENQQRQLWEGGYSSRAMAGPALIAVLLTLVALVAGAYFEQLRWVAPAILLGWIGLYLLLLYRQISVRYFLTAQRFVHQAGVLRRVTDRIETIDIDDISVEQRLVERLLGVGTIRISSSDRTHPELRLYGIAHVGEVAATIDDVRRSERRKRGLHIEAI